MVLHLLFVLFVIFGGFLALRWPFLVYVHPLALAWGIVIELFPFICPLTYLENYLRRSVGEGVYHRGFIEDLLIPILYPDGLTPQIQKSLAIILIAINVVAYSLVVRSFRKSSDKKIARAG